MPDSENNRKYLHFLNSPESEWQKYNTARDGKRLLDHLVCFHDNERSFPTVHFLEFTQSNLRLIPFPMGFIL